MNGVATGTDYTNRIGRKLVMKSIYFKGVIAPSGVTNPGGDHLRTILLYDKQTNGAAPTPADILTVVDPTSPMNLNNRDRFIVLKDWNHGIEAATYTAGVLSGGSPRQKPIKVYKSCNYEVIFNNTTNAVTSIQTGGVFLLTLDSTGTGVETLTYFCRIRFDDA